ncbi:MAG: acyl-CoA/acyl-ACP dehydrogenase [Deltaproteobacteria bacterium]|nr:acyl-CoA/acyl-ACP dehydrogenase [Deltaproteobacteria bacterium]
MCTNEMTNALLPPVEDFAATCVAPMSRRMERDPAVWSAIAARASELGLHDIASGGFYHNPYCDAAALAQIIGCVGQRDAAIALRLFAGLIHSALQSRAAHPLVTAPIFPYEPCAFVMAMNVPVADSYMIRSSASGHELLLIGTTMAATRQYMGFRGISWFAPQSAPVRVMLGNISTSDYASFLDEISLLYQCVTFGLLRATIQYAHAYAHERQTFGRAIVRWQAVSQKLANMAIGYERATACFDHALHHPQTPGAVWQSQCLLCTVLDDIVEGAVQVLGGHGYLEDHPVEKWMRDAQVLKTMLRELGAIIANDTNTHTDTCTARGVA